MHTLSIVLWKPLQQRRWSLPKILSFVCSFVASVSCAVLQYYRFSTCICFTNPYSPHTSQKLNSQSLEIKKCPFCVHHLLVFTLPNCTSPHLMHTLSVFRMSPRCANTTLLFFIDGTFYWVCLCVLKTDQPRFFAQPHYWFAMPLAALLSFSHSSYSSKAILASI